MGELFFSKSDNEAIELILRRGMGVKGHKWQALRFALAKSLQIIEPPGPEFAAPPTSDRPSELHLEQVTGEGKEGKGEKDFTDAYRLLLSTYHGEDLFANREVFIDRLQRHLRRGLEEIRRSWRDGNDFHDYLYQEFYYTPDTRQTEREDSQQIVSLLSKLGVRAAIRETIDGPRLTRFVLSLDSGEDLDRLRRELDKIPFELGYGEGLSVSLMPGERVVALDIPRPEPTWHPVSWSDVADAVRKASGALPVCPGTDVLGRPYLFDLSEAPHLFVAGTTGSGKSVCVHALVLSLLIRDRAVRLAFIDPKEVEFLPYARLGSRLWGDGIAVDPDSRLALLGSLVAEMERRQSVLAELGVVNIAEAQARGSDLPRIVLVVDELADLILQSDAAVTPLIRLAQKARAVGIHLILATQRPEAATFPGLLRSNIPSRIARPFRRCRTPASSLTRAAPKSC